MKGYHVSNQKRVGPTILYPMRALLLGLLQLHSSGRHN